MQMCCSKNHARRLPLSNRWHPLRRAQHTGHGCTTLRRVPPLAAPHPSLLSRLPTAAPGAARVTLTADVCCVCLVLLLLLLQASCAYPLPTSAGVLLQPLGAATALSWVWSSPSSMHKLPGMHAAAKTVCSSFRGVYELLLYIIIDIGVMPGVPAAGVDAFGLPDRCESGAVYAQLLVYGTLMMSLFVPLFVSYVIELHHKLSFWQDRGVAVEADRSVLLPLPHSPVLSHFLVCFAAPLVLWFVAEGVAPYLTPVNLDG